MMNDPEPTQEPEPNDRQRKLIEGAARGLSPQEAARSAGFSASYARKASRLLKQPMIAKAIEAIRAEGRTIAAYGLVEAMKEVESAASFARVNKNSMALVKACELRAKLSGLLIDEIHLKTESLDLRGAIEEGRRRVGWITVSPRQESLSAPKALTDARDMGADTASSGQRGNGQPFGD